MTRYLLDTNIISNAVKPSPAAALTEWMAGQADDSLFVASMTVAEIERGILLLPHGRKRTMLEEWLSGPSGLLTLFDGRIRPFDGRAGLIWARLMAEGRRAGQPRSPLDMIVAATAEAHTCLVVTDNERDFAGLPFVNPLRGGARRAIG